MPGSVRCEGDMTCQIEMECERDGMSEWDRCEGDMACQGGIDVREIWHVRVG